MARYSSGVGLDLLHGPHFDSVPRGLRAMAAPNIVTRSRPGRQMDVASPDQVLRLRLQLHLALTWTTQCQEDHEHDIDQL
jgi:hypothetical protein